MADQQSLFEPSWGFLLFRGIVAILFGIVSLAYPGITTLSLLIFFACFIFVDLIFLIFGLISGRIQSNINWLFWLRAILGLVTSILILFVKPASGTLIFGLTIAVFIGVEAIFLGVFEVIAGFQARKEGGWWAVFLGVLWVIFGFVFIQSPMQSLVALTWTMGIFGIVVGISSIILAFQVRKALKQA